jgi:hypothetical protein
MTQTVTKDDGRATTVAAACCDSVLLSTCCGHEAKPQCCGPEKPTAVCGCGESGRKTAETKTA